MSTETPQVSKEGEIGVSEKPSRFITWHRRVLGFCLVLFALEIGVPLVFVPWTKVWELNLLPVGHPVLASLWTNGYFRGALSGLGLLNIYVAVAELFKQLKAWFGRDQSSASS